PGNPGGGARAQRLGARRGATEATAVGVLWWLQRLKPSRQSVTTPLARLPAFETEPRPWPHRRVGPVPAPSGQRLGGMSMKHEQGLTGEVSDHKVLAVFEDVRRADAAARTLREALRLEDAQVIVVAPGQPGLLRAL